MVLHKIINLMVLVLFLYPNGLSAMACFVWGNLKVWVEFSRISLLLLMGCFRVRRLRLGGLLIGVKGLLLLGMLGIIKIIQIYSR